VFISVTFSTTRLAVDFVGTLLVASLSISFFCADMADSQAVAVDCDEERDSEVWRVWKAETTLRGYDLSVFDIGLSGSC
jgi:hypothetical protein